MRVLLSGVAILQCHTADVVPQFMGLAVASETVEHVNLIIIGSLIIAILIIEPHGLSRLWSIGREKLRLWPFPH